MIKMQSTNYSDAREVCTHPFGIDCVYTANFPPVVQSNFKIIWVSKATLNIRVKESLDSIKV